MQARHWVFTINNPGDELIDGDAIPDLRYMVYQRESGEKEGTVHYQGYLEFSKPKRMGALKKIFKTAHFEVRKGTRTEARDYCMKADTRLEGPFEWGDWIADKQPKAKAIDTFKKAIDEGKSDKELWDSHPWQYLHFHRALGDIRLLNTSGRDWAMSIVYILGRPGIGKSHMARTEYPLAYWKSPGQWWDGYRGQDTVILDEFSGKWFPWDYLLKLLDRYPMNVEIKGGVVPFLAKTIVITTNREPWTLYNRWKFPLEALFRRITTWIYLEGTIEDPCKTTVESILDFYPLVTGCSYEEWLTSRPPKQN